MSLLCRLGLHKWEWLFGNQLRCTRCGLTKEHLP